MGNTKPIPLTPVLIAQAVALAASGATTHAIGKELGIPDSTVRRIQKLPEYNKELETMGSEVLVAARNRIKAEVGKLSNEIIRVLRAQLEDKDSLEAVKIALRVVGFDDEAGPAQETNIQVVLPGQAQDTIEVNSDDILDV